MLLNRNCQSVTRVHAVAVGVRVERGVRGSGYQGGGGTRRVLNMLAYPNRGACTAVGAWWLQRT